MSLATRCTHCGTIFKVVQDQLKVSEGWVRCGRCHEVFNALPALFDLEKDPPPPRPAHLSGGAEPVAQAPSQPRETAPEVSSPGAAGSTAESIAAPAQPPVPAASSDTTAPGSPSAAFEQALARPPADTSQPDAAHQAGLPQDGSGTAPQATPSAVWSEPPASLSPSFTPSPPAARADSGLATGVPIPLASISDVRQPSPAQAQVPSASATLAAPPARQVPDPLVEQGLISDADVALGFDSKPPSGWMPTQPAGLGQQPLDEEDLALEPPPIEAATDFELDTSIAVDDNTPLEAVLASVAPRPGPGSRRPLPPAFEPVQPHEELPLRTMPAPRAWQDSPPSEDLPTTEEEDALDSRYLMPSASRDKRTPHRLEEGPEFVDAQFPSDAFIDAEEDWASDFGPSALDADAPAPLAAPPSATSAPASSAAAGLRAAPAHSLDDRAASRDDEPPDSAPLAEGEEATHVEEGDAPAKLRKRRGKRTDGEAEPEFLRRAQRKAFWRHPATRAALSLAGLLLLATLALQMAHQFRDLIAAYHPASRPLLERMCQLAHCEIKPPLHIEDMQVESATLVRAASDGEGSYRLAVVVHNKSPAGLAWPHVDLTLTDDNGAVIARRVFSPQDAQWLDTADSKAEVTPNGKTDPAAASLPAAAPGQRSTTLQWRLLAPDIKPAGYTAELFYP